MTGARKSDETVLAMLRLRCGGWSSAQVARHMGLKDDWVRNATRRVIIDDLAHSGEPADAVMAGYGWRV